MSGGEQGMAVTNRDSSLGAGAFVLPPTSWGSVRKEECGVAHVLTPPRANLTSLDWKISFPVNFWIWLAHISFGVFTFMFISE